MERVVLTIHTVEISSFHVELMIVTLVGESRRCKWKKKQLSRRRKLNFANRSSLVAHTFVDQAATWSDNLKRKPFTKLNAIVDT